MSFFGKKRKKIMQEFFNDAFDVFEEIDKRFEKMTENLDDAEKHKTEKSEEAESCTKEWTKRSGG